MSMTTAVRASCGGDLSVETSAQRRREGGVADQFGQAADGVALSELEELSTDRLERPRLSRGAEDELVQVVEVESGLCSEREGLDGRHDMDGLELDGPMSDRAGRDGGEAQGTDVVDDQLDLVVFRE